MSDYLGQGLPWADYLHFRAKAIAAFRAEGKTFAEIVDVLNLADDEHAERIYHATINLPASAGGIAVEAAKCAVCQGPAPAGHEVCAGCVTNAPMRVMVNRSCADCGNAWVQPSASGRCPRCRSENVGNDRVRVCGLKRL